MFNFFKKNTVNKKIPADYSHIFSQQQYEKMLSYVFAYFKDKGETITGLDDGKLRVDNMEYGLDNLVRMVAAADAADWESIVYTHFNKINYSEDAYTYFFKDYDHAKQYLRVLIKHEELLNTKYGDGLVYRKDFPGTCTVLVFDYENQFRYVKTDEIGEWALPQEVLFEEALTNTAAEELTISKISHDDGWDMYSFFSGDFSSSRMIELEKHFDFAIGQFGAIVAIPTKGTAFAAPVTDGNVGARIGFMAPLLQQFFGQDPGNISNDFYWVYQGTITQFPTKDAADGFVTVSLPGQLIALLGENQQL